jgi:hypothetical protein
MLPANMEYFSIYVNKIFPLFYLLSGFFLLFDISKPLAQHSEEGVGGVGREGVRFRISILTEA